jgi:DNA polymerase III delta subunit
MKLTLIGGPGEHFAIQKLSELLQGKQYHSYDLEELDSIGKVTELSGGVGLFAKEQVQIVLLRGPFSAATAVRKDLEKLLQDNSTKLLQDLELILFQTGNLDKRTSLYKTAKKSHHVYEYGKELPADKKDLIPKMIATAGLETSAAVSQELAGRLEGFDMLTIANEVSKLITLVTAEDRKQVHSGDLDIISKPLDQEVWELFSLSVNNKKQAYELLSELLRQQVAVQLIIGFLASQLRGMHQIEIGLSTLPPFLRKKHSSVLSKLGSKKLNFLILKLADLDLAIKSGKLMPEAGLKLFIALI